MNDSFFDSLSDSTKRYAPSITAQQQALRLPGQATLAYHIDQRGLPIPLWVRRGLPDASPQAWDTLQDELCAAPLEKPFCIYIHIPFCASRCEFCDCYAFALKKNLKQHTGGYTAVLERECKMWAAQGNLAQRPVSTVHFGGGTPTMLGGGHLKNLIETLRTHFAIADGTEWALESTSSALSAPMFSRLHQLGFTRLHIGTQSLQDDVRSAIGRRENAAAVIEKIKKSLSLGWIVSVDVIVGLPEQTPQGLVDDLDRLIDCGVEGFSIYELQHSPRNRRFIEKHNLHTQSAEQRYLLFQLAFHHLQSHGFAKNVFNHLAKGRDNNLYFTFPKRNEDLLALGSIADGVFGNYHYRHPEYLPYLHGVSTGSSGLLGGLRRNQIEDRLHNLEVEIMSGRIDPPVFTKILGEEKTQHLLDRWLAHGMIEADPEGFVLTPNGAWFNGQILQEIIYSVG